MNKLDFSIGVKVTGIRAKTWEIYDVNLPTLVAELWVTGSI
jgi:hypothetical protein